MIQFLLRFTVEKPEKGGNPILLLLWRVFKDGAQPQFKTKCLNKTWIKVYFLLSLHINLVNSQVSSFTGESMFGLWALKVLQPVGLSFNAEPKASHECINAS